MKTSVLKRSNQALVKAVATTCVLLLISILVGCKQNKTQVVDIANRLQIDSLVKALKGEDALLALERRHIGDDDKLMVVSVWRELGDRNRHDSHFSEANQLYSKCLEAAIQMRDTIEIIRALNNIATTYRRLGFLDIATEYHYQALYHVNNFSDTVSVISQKNRVITLNGLGNIFLSLDNFHLADSVLRLALKGEEKLGSKLGQAINYANLGSILEKTNQIDSAWVYYDKSMELNTAVNSEVGKALCHDHFGSLYETEGKLDSALNEYEQAYELMYNSGDEWHGLESQVSLARVYHKLGIDDKAKSQLDTALSIANKIKSNEHLASIYGQYYTIYKDQGDLQKALDNFLKAGSYADSLYNIKKMSEIQNVRVSIERKRQNDQMAQMQQRLYIEQSTKRWALVAAAIIFILGVIVFLQMLYFLNLRNKKVRMIQDMEDMRDRFFTNISHEFRTPLTVIQSIAEEMRDADSLPTADLHHMAAVIEHHEKELLQMTNQILDIAKFRDNGGKAFRPWVNGDIVSFATVMVEAYRDLAKVNQMGIVFKATPEKIMLDFIPVYMRNIFSNLLSNSIKYGYPETDIQVVIEKVNKNVRIVIKDKGKGIKEEDQHRVFDPFYQGENGISTIGTGVGLSLVKTAVESMDGMVSFVSTEQVGTTFTIILPLTHQGGPYPSLKEEDLMNVQVDKFYTTSSAPSDKQAGPNDLRVLIVEDSTEVAKYIARHVGDEYGIYYAFDGISGYERARELIPDIIISDIMMPGIDGLELCRRVRADELLNHIPIIMVTAKVTQADKEQGLEAGADAYMEKPFRAEELQLRVKKLLEMRALLRDKWVLTTNSGNEKQPQSADIVKSEQCKEAGEQSQSGDIRDDEYGGKVSEAPISNAFVDKFTQLARCAMSSGHVQIADIAMQMYVTREQLNRKIKASTGLTASQLLTRLRIEKAKHLFVGEPELTIMEVSLKCGINDVAYFTTLFKRETGFTPAVFRQTYIMKQKG